MITASYDCQKIDRHSASGFNDFGHLAFGTAIASGFSVQPIPAKTNSLAITNNSIGENMNTVKLPVKSTLVMNFGKFDFVYKPLDEKGEKMLQMVIAMSSKPDSKRKNFSKADVLKAIELTAQNNISLEFIQAEINYPELPSKPELNTPITFNKAMPVVKDADLGFLG